MNCAQVKELLSPFYDGELGDSLASNVREHVAHCPACEAELASFQQLSVCVCSAETPQPASENWQCITARLKDSSSQPVMVASSADRAGPDGANRIFTLRGGRTVAAAILTLAASLFLIVGLRTGKGPSPLENSPSVASAVDYGDVFQLFKQQPQLAMEKLSERYGGREVSAEQAEAMLGYRPSITADLPSHTRLVSTRVLKLPQCKCAGGKCTCGPGECNCAACLCERPDGTKFLVFEQCKTQDVTFGDLPFVVARRDNRDVQFIRSDKQLAVSWIKDNRRLTAIGLKDEAEAESLMAALTPESQRG